MTDRTDILREVLTAAGIPVKGSYRRDEVCRILGISERTFWRLCNRTGPGDTPPLRSIKPRGHRRVTYPALAEFLARSEE